MNIRIYRNFGCCESRAALALLGQRGVPFEIVDSVESTLTHGELEQLLVRLALQARDSIRHSEPPFATSGLDADTAQRIAPWASHPTLRPRPAGEIGTRTCIGRSPERVLELVG